MSTVEIHQEDLDAIYACDNEDDVLRFLDGKSQQDVMRLVLQLTEMLKTKRFPDEQRRKLYTACRRGQFIMDRRREDSFRLKRIVEQQKRNPPP